MDLNYKGTKSNTFSNTKSPHPAHDIIAGICGTDSCGVWSFSVNFYPGFTKRANKATSQLQPYFENAK